MTNEYEEHYRKFNKLILDMGIKNKQLASKMIKAALKGVEYVNGYDSKALTVDESFQTAAEDITKVLDLAKSNFNETEWETLNNGLTAIVQLSRWHLLSDQHSMYIHLPPTHPEKLKDFYEIWQFDYQ